MSSSEKPDLWTFPEGAVGHDQSVKGYRVEGTDGHCGEVSWAVYAPGESYCVVTYREHLHMRHHLVPAGAVTRVDHAGHTVTLNVTIDEVKASPEHEDPETEVDWDQVNRFERGMLGGGGVWPYTDV
jgi:hypothetical protein